MKKKFVAIIGVTMTALMSTAVSASAKTVYTKWVNEQIEAGYSAEDACGTLAVLASGKENVIPLIYQKHKELGDWESTAEYYGIDKEEFNENISIYKRDIPDSIYKEMSASGMSDTECYDFAIRTSNAQMDIQTTWEAKKNGKTINDLIKEQTERENAKLKTTNDFIFGDITATEYTEKMKSISPDMDISDILAFAREEKRGWMEFRKATSGITDEELKAAADAGITDFFAACRMKDAEAITNKTFADMLVRVRADKDVDEVIRANISTEKINMEIDRLKDSAE